MTPVLSRLSFYRVAFLSWCVVAFPLAGGNMTATKKPPIRPIDLNAANSQELQQVPGIGPATADKILQMRKAYGAFRTVDDLLAIRGIGKKRLDKMRKYLVAGRTLQQGRSVMPGRSAQSAAASKSADCNGRAKSGQTASAPIRPAAVPAKSAKKVVPPSAKFDDASSGTTSGGEPDEEPQ